MSDLITVSQHDESTARDVRDTLADLQRGHTLGPEGLVIGFDRQAALDRGVQPATRPA